MPIKEYYNGTNWVLEIYVSQNSQTYPYTYSSATGTYVDGSSGANDWTNVETDYQQTGLSFASSFSWNMTNPQFLVAGGWQVWNLYSGSTCSLGAYVAFQPILSNNTIAVQKISNYGVNVYYYGPSPPNNDGTTLSWSTPSTFYLTMGHTGTGSVSPSSGNKNCNSQVSISATPTTTFCYWTGTGSGSYSGKNNPATVTMNAAISETASFANPCPQLSQR